MVKFALIAPMAVCKAGLALCLLADGRALEAAAFAALSIASTISWAQTI